MSFFCVKNEVVISLSSVVFLVIERFMASRLVAVCVLVTLALNVNVHAEVFAPPSPMHKG